MGASAYVGRVGGLALALGVGSAVVLGTAGVAYAETGDGSQPTHTTTSSSGAESATTGGATAQTGTGGAAADDVKSGDEKSNDEKSNDEKSEDADDPDTSGTADSETADDADLTDTPDDADQHETTSPGTTPTDPAAGEEPVEPVAGAETTGGDRTPPAADVTTRSEQSQQRRSKTAAPAFTVKIDVKPAVAEQDSASDVVAAVKQVAEKPAAAARTVVVEQVSTLVQSVQAVQAAATPTVAPVVAAATAPARATVAPLVSRLLAAFGLGSLTGSPSAPTPAWSLAGLLALASRREFDRSVSSQSATASNPLTRVALAAAAAPYDPAKDYVPTGSKAVSGNTDFITAVTGPGGLNNTTTRFGIGGTDLGIMWDNGIADDPTTPVNEHQVLMVFGDTFSNRTPVRTGIWRMNTLFRSTDTFLNNGIYVADGIPHDPGTYSGSPMSDPNFSREIIGNYHYGVGPEVTMIPTAGISVPGAGKNGATRQYVNFMAVRSWDTPGRWTTNYSAIAYSDDNGQNWTVVPASSVRPAAAGRSTLPFVNGEQNFQQGAYTRKYVTDPVTGQPLKDANGRDITDGYIYSYGTPAGRAGTAYLSRVKEADILDKTKYQYWDGATWVNGNPAAAKPILPKTTTSSFFGLIKTTSYPSVSEMSVQYNSYEKKYIMLYGDKNNNIVMRKADTPEGPWSAPVTLVTSSKVPGLYAPMIHPWSSTPNLSQEDQKYLYWNMSTWNDYQVKTFRTDLSKV